MVASSWLAKQTKPKPFEVPLSSIITLALEMLPNGVKASRSFSSSIMSSMFFTYRLTPWNLFARSSLSASNFSRRSRSRSRFFCARPTKSVLPSCSEPWSASTAVPASSWFSKLTKPKQRDLPSGSFITTADLISPWPLKSAVSASSSTVSAKFLTKMLVYDSLPPASPRSLRGTKKPTKTFLPLRSIPFTLVTASVAASCVS